MANSKYIILVQLPVKPEYLHAVMAISSATLKPTLLESGCEVFYQTFKADDPSTLIFFEVFTSKDAYDLHNEASYTREFFNGIHGKLAGKPVIIPLHAFKNFSPGSMEEFENTAGK